MSQIHALALRILATVAVCTGALPAQQLVFARNDNPSYAAISLGFGWPPLEVAFRFTANAPTLAAAQIFTGSHAPALHTLEIRHRDPISGLPGAAVGPGGSFMTRHVRMFQGATFAQPVNLTVNQDYFLVWMVTDTGYQAYQHSIGDPNQPGSALVEMHTGVSGHWTLQSQEAAKFRLFAPHAAGTTASYGFGKPRGAGEPTIGLSGWPALGSPIDVWLENAPYPTTAVLILGTPIPAGIPSSVATLWVTPDVLVTKQTQLHGIPLGGSVSHTVFVPNMPAAIGFPLSFQWGVLDRSAAHGLSHSAAVTAIVR